MANKDNPATGAKFELLIKEYFRKKGISLERPFILKIGASSLKKEHNFDLGSKTLKIVIECKSHTWTETGNAPSAKMSVWNEAMYYFSLVPKKYKKIFFFKKSLRRGESLGQYYIRRYSHLIPKNVELWEFCVNSNRAKKLY